MIKKLTKYTILIFHVVVAASPYVLICYLFKTWVDHGDVTYISLATGLYHWVGIDPSIRNIIPGTEGLYNLYVFFLKLPLLLWLFIISIPSFIRVYNYAKE